MKMVFPLFLFAVSVLFIPAYAQNVSHDEIDIKIRELIQECQEEVMANESLTEAEKTVAKRNCATEITNEYKNVEIDYKELAEKKALLQIMQNCDDWHPQYRFLTENQFRLQKNHEVVTDCILLYNDSVWQYIGDDRLEKLSERLNEIKAESKQTSETLPIEISVDIPVLESNVINAQQEADNVADLEEKVRLLEEELAKKDAIMREQIKVIMELANRIKNVMFGSFYSFFPQL